MESRDLLNKTLIIASMTSAVLFVVLMLAGGEDILMLLGAVLFLSIFISLGLWAAHDSPRFKGKNKLRIAMVASFGLLFGGSFVYVEMLFPALVRTLFDFKDPSSLPPLVVFLCLTALTAYAYYKVLRFSRPKMTKPKQKAVDPKQTRLR